MCVWLIVPWRSLPVAEVLIIEETDLSRGWSYLVQLCPDGPDCVPKEHTVTLSWVDHDHWTGGRVPPSKLMEKLMRILLSRVGQGDCPREIPARFDATQLRRWIAGIDELVQRGED